MTDPRSDAAQDDLPENHPGATAPKAEDDDARSDIEQAVAARADAVERGEGGPEPETFTDTGMHDGVGGTGDEVRNQDLDQQ